MAEDVSSPSERGYDIVYEHVEVRERVGSHSRVRTKCKSNCGLVTVLMKLFSKCV